ncbi:MAG: sigma 54-interacting transcriptional regulator, partial [Flavobacteriaceae bacterium]
VVRLGEAKERPVDVRIICATNRNLHAEVKKNGFRQDLLYRINTMEILIPPLRDRKEDIPLLAEHFLERNKKKYRKGRLRFSVAAMQALNAYAWPGNIRELEHMVERAVILCEGNEITKNDMRFTQGQGMNESIETLNLEEMERKLIVRALEKHRGNITNASKDLGITSAALYRRMEKFNL